MLTLSSAINSGYRLFLISHTSPPHPLSPERSLPSITTPPPNPVPSVIPSKFYTASRFLPLRAFYSLWECAHERLAISEKVTVIIDEYRYSELFRKERAHCYSASETWEVWQITDYACLVVCRSGKRETDCRRFLRKQRFSMASNPDTNVSRQRTISSLTASNLTGLRFHGILG